MRSLSENNRIRLVRVPAARGVVYDRNGISREDWEKLGPHYKAQGENSWDGTINATVRSRK